MGGLGSVFARLGWLEMQDRHSLIYMSYISNFQHCFKYLNAQEHSDIRECSRSVWEGGDVAIMFLLRKKRLL